MWYAVDWNKSEPENSICINLHLSTPGKIIFLVFKIRLFSLFINKLRHWLKVISIDSYTWISVFF